MAKGRLGKALERTLSSSHGYTTSIETFPPVDVERTAASLQLEEQGAARGAANEPPADFVGTDVVEGRVVDHVENLRTAAENQFRDMMNSYRDRLFDLEFDTKVAQIRSAAELGINALVGETQKGLDQLHAAREDMARAERALEAFREEHGIDRLAEYPRSKWEARRKWAILALLLVVEMILNGMFFAQGNRLGLLGGGMQALVFAALNIGLAYFAGRYAANALGRREAAYRWIARAGLAAYAAAGLALNLVIAHYRSAFAVDPEHPGLVAMRTLNAGLFAGLDATSFQMIGIGILFSLIALFDARRLTDGYLGYEAPSRMFEERRQAYQDARADLIEAMTEEYEDAHAAMNEAHDDLTRRRSESRALHEAMARVSRAFDAHLAHLERAGNDLLNVYREANRRARETGSPPSFRKPWKMARPNLAAFADARYTDEEVSRITLEAKRELDERSGSLKATFDESMERLKSLDSLDAR